MPTIKDIARLCGVSAATVSYVINNRRGKVSAEVRDRVLQTVRETNYRPLPSLQRDALPQILTLGIASGIVPMTADTSYFRAILQHLQTAIEVAGQNTLLFNSHLFHEDPLQSLRIYCDGRCDGLLVIAPNTQSPLTLSLQARGFPFVLVGTTEADPAFPSCDIDNITSARLVVEEFLWQGHRRIAYCAGPDANCANQLRLEGYRQALKSWKIPLQPKFVGALDEFQIWTQKLLHLPENQRPTAFVCFDDRLAVLLLTEIQRLGLRVPEDISLIGFDDLSSLQADPPLTSVRQPFAQIAEKSIEMLLARIHGQTLEPPQVLLPGELIRRQSVHSILT